MQSAETKTIACFALLLVLSSSALSQTRQEAVQYIQEAEVAIQEMQDGGIPTKRATDLLSQAQFMLESQVALEQTYGRPDYSMVIEPALSILEIRNTAFRAKDDIDNLENIIEELNRQDVPMTDVLSIYEEAKKEFKDERFEQAKEDAEKTYEEISKAQALSNRVQALYEASSKNISSFVQDNWQNLLIGLVFLGVFGSLSKRELEIWRLKQEQGLLELRRDVIQDLARESQYQYFDSKEMPEETYRVRMIKFGKMIRDINRQLPLVKQKLRKKRSFIQFNRKKGDFAS